MEGDYFFNPPDWNFDKEIAVIELNDFVGKYLSDLNLGSISNSFKAIVELEEPTYLSGFTPVKTWIEFWEYRSTCDGILLCKAMTNPEFPPDFPPLDYHSLNRIVFHYLLDVNLVEEARTFALHTSDDNPDGIDYVDYTVVESVREFIVPFTAYISGYFPNSVAGKTFLFPPLSKKLPDLDGQQSKQQPRPPKPGQGKLLLKPPQPKGKRLQLSPCLDQLIDVDVMPLLPTELDYIQPSVVIHSSDSSEASELTEQPESTLPQSESSLGVAEDYSDSDENLPPSKIRREGNGDN